MNQSNPRPHSLPPRRDVQGRPANDPDAAFRPAPQRGPAPGQPAPRPQAPPRGGQPSRMPANRQPAPRGQRPPAPQASHAPQRPGQPRPKPYPPQGYGTQNDFGYEQEPRNGYYDAYGSYEDDYTQRRNTLAGDPYDDMPAGAQGWMKWLPTILSGVVFLVSIIILIVLLTQ